MGCHTDATIEANENNAREGYVIAAQPGYFLLDDHDHNREGDPLPILAWRIGKDSECDCVLPVTCVGTHESQTYVLQPDGRVTWNAKSYYSAAPEYETLAEWRADVTGQNEPGTGRAMGLEDDAKIDDPRAEVRAAADALDKAAKVLNDAQISYNNIRDALAIAVDRAAGQNEPPEKRRTIAAKSVAERHDRVTGQIVQLKKKTKRASSITDDDIPF
jgi:hypothetical protein